MITEMTIYVSIMAEQIGSERASCNGAPNSLVRMPALGKNNGKARSIWPCSTSINRARTR
jgi:hypothetical protein